MIGTDQQQKVVGGFVLASIGVFDPDGLAPAGIYVEGGPPAGDRALGRLAVVQSSND